ncbi:MAG: hypothetical protein GXP60_03920 [Epsilonproteobacteria bacterium]|nr:hypothetical protein [Campylobacterota bacterium]
MQLSHIQTGFAICRAEHFKIVNKKSVFYRIVRKIIANIVSKAVESAAYSFGTNFAFIKINLDNFTAAAGISNRNLEVLIENLLSSLKSLKI